MAGLAARTVSRNGHNGPPSQPVADKKFKLQETAIYTIPLSGAAVATLTAPHIAAYNCAIIHAHMVLNQNDTKPLAHYCKTADIVPDGTDDNDGGLRAYDGDVIELYGAELSTFSFHGWDPAVAGRFYIEFYTLNQ